MQAIEKENYRDYMCICLKQKKKAQQNQTIQIKKYFTINLAMVNKFKF